MDLQYMQLANTAENKEKLAAFFHEKSNEFPEPLESKVDVYEYTCKLLDNGYVFVTLDKNIIAGVIGGYANDLKNYQAYGSVFVTDKKIRGSGAAKRLFQMQRSYCAKRGMKTIHWTTNRKNIAAIKFYEKMNVPIVDEKCNDKVIGYILPI